MDLPVPEPDANMEYSFDSEHNVTGHKIFTHNESLFYVRVMLGQSGTWPLAK